MSKNKIIRSGGMDQDDLVDLLDRLTGRIWVPIGVFNDIGNAVLAAIGSTEKTGMAFDASTDEAVDTMLVVPKDVDFTKAITIKVYWSSDGTDDTKDVDWSIVYGAFAADDDVGATGTTLLITDLDSATADDLNIADVMTIPADVLAANTEMLSLVLRRDASADTLAVDAECYGILIEYTPIPEVRT